MNHLSVRSTHLRILSVGPSPQDHEIYKQFSITEDVDIYELQRGTRKLPILMCPQTASELHVVEKAHFGSETPPWSPDEDSDDDDLSSNRVLYCTYCQDYVFLPFGSGQCPKCKVILI